ncbi:MAG: KH domain-containing protein, partial [Candidatus Hydrothermarchaeaceae archaeon]
MEYVKIPRRRIAVLIGKNGAVKSKIERELQVKLDINSEEGIVKVENCGDDVLAEWKSRDIVRAVGCGMNPLKALKLKSDDYILEVIELTDIVGRSRKAVSRQKGRIIGRKGKTR